MLPEKVYAGTLEFYVSPSAGTRWTPEDDYVLQVSRPFKNVQSLQLARKADGLVVGPVLEFSPTRHCPSRSLAKLIANQLVDAVVETACPLADPKPKAGSKRKKDEASSTWALTVAVTLQPVLFWHYPDNLDRGGTQDAADTQPTAPLAFTNQATPLSYSVTDVVWHLAEENADPEDAQDLLQEDDRDVRDDVFEMVAPADWAWEQEEPSGLKCVLYRYQRRALAWMAWREGHSRLTLPSTASTSAAPPALTGSPLGPPTNNVLWERITLKSGASIFMHTWSGWLGQQLPASVGCPSGGILAEEMGLGKTVETIALLLLRPAPWGAPLDEDEAPRMVTPRRGVGAGDGAPRGSRIATRGRGVRSSGLRPPIVPAVAQPAGSSSAAASASSNQAKLLGPTLIVTPTALTKQWENELAGHSSLRVCVYDGLRWHLKVAEDHRRKVEKQELKKNKGKQIALETVDLGTDLDLFSSPEQIAASLLKCDVVLTTYNALQKEACFWPQDVKAYSFRHEKKYKILESPLLQIHWWRLVLDEAQEVGPNLNSVSTMAARLNAHHRWCVTGTPIGPGGLSDLLGLLRVLRYEPFASNDGAFRNLIAHPYLQQRPFARQRLEALLKPVMWRSTKQDQAADHPLPPRSLQVVYLQFPADQRHFYDHILASLHNARKAIKEHEEEAAAEAQQAKSKKKPWASKQEQEKAKAKQKRLLEVVNNELRQLRLACIHPQMTLYWRQLSSEMQLEQGGALTMDQIMRRMRDEAQLKLQKAERDYCAAQNILASKLMQAATKAAKREAQGPVSPTGEDRGESSKPSSRPSKKQRVSSGAPNEDAASNAPELTSTPSSPTSPGGIPDSNKPHGRPKPLSAEELQNEAMERLQASYRVAEKGIQATDLHDLNELDDIEANNTSIRAWRLIEANTAQQLSKMHTLIGQHEDAAKMAAIVQKKLEDVRDSANQELAKVESRLGEVLRQLGLKADRVLQQWQQLMNAGLENVRLKDAHSWLETLGTSLAGAKEEEREERAKQEESADEKTNLVLMGKLVVGILSAEEQKLSNVRSTAEAVVGTSLFEQALARAKAAMTGISSQPNANTRSGRGSSPAAAAAAMDRVLQCGVTYSLAAAVVFASAAEPALLTGQSVGLVVRAGVEGKQQAEKQLRKQTKTLEKTLQSLEKRAAEAGPLKRKSLDQLLLLLDAVKGRLEVLRLERERYQKELQVEIAWSKREAVGAEVMAAAEGYLAGYSSYTHKSMPELRRTVDTLHATCVELHHRRTFLHNQVTDYTKPATLDTATRALGMEPQATDPNGKGPQGIVHKGLDPHRTDTQGKDPKGTNSLGTVPYGTNPWGTYPKHSSMDIDGSREGEPAFQLATGIGDHGLNGLLECTTTQVGTQRPREGDELGTECRPAARLKVAASNGSKAASYGSKAATIDPKAAVATGASLGVQGVVQCLVMQPGSDPGERAGETGKFSSQTPKCNGRVQMHGNEAISILLTTAAVAMQNGAASRLSGANTAAPTHADTPASAPSTSKLVDKSNNLQGRGVLGSVVENVAIDRVGTSNQFPSFCGSNCTNNKTVGSLVQSNDRQPSQAGMMGLLGPLSSNLDRAGSNNPHVNQVDQPVGCIEAGSNHPTGSYQEAGSNDPPSSNVEAGSNCPTGSYQEAGSSNPASSYMETGSNHPAGSYQEAGSNNPFDSHHEAASNNPSSSYHEPARIPVRAGSLTKATDSLSKATGGLTKATGGFTKATASNRIIATDTNKDVVANATSPSSETTTSNRPVATGFNQDVGANTTAPSSGTAPAGVPHAAGCLPTPGNTAAKDSDADHPLPEVHSDPAGSHSQTCRICLSIIVDNMMIFNCGHFFCENCTIQLMLRVPPECPVCRVKVNQNQIFRAKLAIADSQGAAGEVDPPEGPDILSVKVRGVWMTKLEGLLRRLIWLSENAPEDKSLVFSQFPEALRLVSKALHANGLKHVELRGDKIAMRDALKRFQEEGEVRVFLLSLKTGAAGLTLTQANRVFLLEPALDPAIEQQAVARVHRIGQNRPVTITRLIVKDTIEADILQRCERKQRLFDSMGSSHVWGDGEGTSLAYTLAKKEDVIEGQEFHDLLDAVLLKHQDNTSSEAERA